MKFLFIGITPSAQLQKALLERGVEAETAETLPSRARKNPTAFVAFGPSVQPEHGQIQKLRKLFPTSWLTLVLKDSWLQKETFLQELLDCAPDDLWIREHWEAMFLLSVPKLLKQQRNYEEIRSLKKQIRGLKVDYDKLTKHSDHLVQQLQRDLTIATNIQRSLIPKAFPPIPGVTINVKYIPSLGVGGDYYDIFSFDDHNRFGVLLADSQTHGMAAALLSVLVKVRLEEMKERFPDSKSFVAYLNSEIQQVHQKEMTSLSLLYGIFDRTNLTFQYTSAGNLKPLLWRLGEASPLPTPGNPSLGGIDKFEFNQNIITLKPADRLIFYTDGLDAPLKTEHQSTSEHLLSFLKNRSTTPDPLEFQIEIMGTIDRYLDHRPLPDDITLIQFSVDEHALYVASESK